LISILKIVYLQVAGIFLLLLSAPAYAGDISDWSQKADLICLAHCVNKEASPVPFNSTTGAVYDVITWSFQVQTILKGDKSVSSFVVVTHDLDRAALTKKGITTYSFPEYFTQFAPSANYLLFLKVSPEDGTYQLVNPYRTRETAWEVPRHLPPDDTTAPLAVRLLNIGATTLSLSDEAAKIRGMGFLAEFSEFLDENNAYSAHMGDAAHGLNRDSAKPRPDAVDPLVQQIRDRVHAIILPEVVAYLKDDDTSIREESVLTLAALQQTAVIPTLIDLANSGSPNSGRAIEAIIEYATDASAIALAPYLVSPNQNQKIKEAVSQSLRSSQDPQLIPYLLQAVNDQDYSVVYRAVSTLFDITGEMPEPTMAAFAQVKEKYVLYWNHWAATNATLLQKFDNTEAITSKGP